MEVYNVYKKKIKVLNNKITEREAHEKVGERSF